MSTITLTDEFRRGRDLLHLNEEDFRQLLDNSLEAAFQPPETRAQLHRIVGDELNRISKEDER